MNLPPERLTNLCLDVLSDNLVDVLYRYARCRWDQQRMVTFWMDKSLDNIEEEIALHFYSNLPTGFTNKIIKDGMLKYVEKYTTHEEEDAVRSYPVNVFIQEDHGRKVNRNYFTLEDLNRNCGGEEYRFREVPMTTIFRVLLRPSPAVTLTDLDLSMLKKLGRVCQPLAKRTRIPESMVAFENELITCIPNLISLKRLNLSNKKFETCLPICTDAVLEAIGNHLHRLEFLNISFIKGMTGRGLTTLVKDPSVKREGCPSLGSLMIFDCGFFYRDVANVVRKLPELTFIGYQETGHVIKHIYKKWMEEMELEIRPLKLTHVNHMGTRSRKLIPKAYRFRKPHLTALINLCPTLKNLKIRVQDQDVEGLVAMEHLASVELVYLAPNRSGDPGQSTAYFLSQNGRNLTSVAILCHHFSPYFIKVVGENCPNLLQFYYSSSCMVNAGRSFEFVGHQVGLQGEPITPPDLPWNHEYFRCLQTLYIRVGDNHLNKFNLDFFILPYILKNVHHLKELFIAIRSESINDDLMEYLFQNCDLGSLTSLTLAIAGNNNMNGVLPVTVDTAEMAFLKCPNLKRMANVISWTRDEAFDQFIRVVKLLNYDIEIVSEEKSIK